MNPKNTNLVIRSTDVDGAWLCTWESGPEHTESIRVTFLIPKKNQTVPELEKEVLKQGYKILGEMISAM